MGLFSGRKNQTPDNGIRPLGSVDISLPKLSTLFSDGEEIKPERSSTENLSNEAVRTSANARDSSNGAKKRVTPKSPLSSNHSDRERRDNRALGGLGRKATMRQQQKQSSQQASGLQEIAGQRAESLSRIARRNSIKRSVSRKIARSESRRQMLNIKDDSFSDGQSSGGLRRNSGVLGQKAGVRGVLSSSHQGARKSSTIGGALSPVSPRSCNGEKGSDLKKIEPHLEKLSVEENDGNTLNKEVDDDLDLNHASIRNFDTLSRNADSLSIISSRRHTSSRSSLPVRSISLATSGSRSRKRPPPLLGNLEDSNAPPSALDWPSGACFGSDGGFMTGGFKITEDGMVGKPPAAKREDSDEAPDGSPTSSKGLVVSSLKEFRAGPTIGAGAGGRVYIAEHVPSGKTMAMKVVNVYDKQKRIQLLKELETLSTHVSRFLVRFYGAFYDGSGAVHIALEYMDHGCLSSVVQCVGAIPEKIVQMIAYDCLRGLRFLHRHHVLHRDFKTANILLSRKLCCAKLSDFGLARDLNAGVSKVETFVGTVAYMSPERLQGSKYTYASDIWALGVSVVECLLGRYPFETPKNYFDYLEAATAPNMLQGFKEESYRFSPEARDFVELCTFTDPKRRPASNQLLEHPWVKGLQRDTELFGSWLDEFRIISKMTNNRKF